MIRLRFASLLGFLLVSVQPFLPNQSVYAYDITSGVGGSWYDPARSGEGFVLQPINPSQIIVYWFTYDSTGNQFWMGGVGQVSGSRLVVEEVLAPRGGRFGPNFDPNDVEYPVWGTLEFEFSDCNTGAVNYSGPSAFGSGSLNLTRLTNLWGLNCDGTVNPVSSVGSGVLNPGFAGSWYDPGHSGEGFIVEVLNETTAAVLWFTYDTEGNPAWFLNVGEISGASIVFDTFLITSGARFGPNFDPADVVYENWGPAVFTFGSCGNGAMRYLPREDFGIEGVQLLQRLTALDNIDCGFLADTHGISGTIKVAANSFIDSDTNDPSAPDVSNDLDGAPQQISSPANVSGFVTAVGTGQAGDRFETDLDEFDVYVLPMRAGEQARLTIADWDQSDPEAIDLDLYIGDDDDVIDSSLTTGQEEIVTAPRDDLYLVVVNAFSGSSNYILKTGQFGNVAAQSLNVASPMADGEVLAGLISDPPRLDAERERELLEKVARVEKENALTRKQVKPGGEVVYSIPVTRIDHLQPHPLTMAGKAKITPEEWLAIRVSKKLASSGVYKYAGPNYLQTLHAEPNDPIYPAQWHYPIMRLPEAWNEATGSSDVVVAVIDSGVHPHPDLVDNTDYSLGYDFVTSFLGAGDGDGRDSYASDPGPLAPDELYVSHGTHVAGTVAADTNNGFGLAGVAWSTTIMPVRVFGVDKRADCSWINDALRWAGGFSNVSETIPARTADIVNLSLGTRLRNGSYSQCPGRREIIEALHANGVIVVASAGNDQVGAPGYPASHPGVISVAATTLTDTRAPYSNFGSTIDVAAPGGNRFQDVNQDGFPDAVLSTGSVVPPNGFTVINDFYFLDGTSMAAPHASGLFAILKSIYPQLNSQILNAAIANGDITVDLGAPGRDDFYGHGRLDASKAVAWAKAQAGSATSMAYATASPSALLFDAATQAGNVELLKTGTGELQITGAGVTDDWLSVDPVSLNADNFGTFRINVDRAGLIDGDYFGAVGFFGSDDSVLPVYVSMRVGERVQGDAGQIYGLLLDQWTLANVKQWGGLSNAGIYDYDLPSNPPGTYYILFGSDMDRDFTICDAGEFCQLYPTDADPTEIAIENEDVSLQEMLIGVPQIQVQSTSSGSDDFEFDPSARQSPLLKRIATGEGVPISVDR